LSEHAVRRQHAFHRKQHVVKSVVRVRRHRVPKIADVGFAKVFGVRRVRGRSAAVRNNGRRDPRESRISEQENVPRENLRQTSRAIRQLVVVVAGARFAEKQSGDRLGVANDRQYFQIPRGETREAKQRLRVPETVDRRGVATGSAEDPGQPDGRVQPRDGDHGGVDRVVRVVTEHFRTVRVDHLVQPGELEYFRIDRETFLRAHFYASRRANRAERGRAAIRAVEQTTRAA